MKHLRHQSARPDLVVDERGRTVLDPASVTRVGRPGPFGRSRLVGALPTNGSGPVRLKPPTVLHDEDGAYVADADGNLIGRAGITVSRMLSARWTENTRHGLGG